MNIGIIGSGAIVDTFLDAMSRVPGMDCVAICSRNPEGPAKQLAEKYHIQRIVQSYELLLNDDQVDFIYIALPNSLHYAHALQALQAGKHVICEKTFTSTVAEAEQLIQLAESNHLFLFEAITTIHLPLYPKIREFIHQIGDIKVIQSNYSQYSSRYDSYLEQKITNMFDPNFSGGALMDINCYNIHFVVGLFGKPDQVKYYPNMGFNGIDTSGVAVLKYETFTAQCVGAKDSSSMSFISIQGTKGTIHVNGPANHCESIVVRLGKEEQQFTVPDNSNRMVFELRDFLAIYESKDYIQCYELLKHTRRVMEVIVAARQSAGIVFPADL